MTTDARRRPRGRRVVAEWVIILVVALLTAAGLRAFVVESFVVPTASMFPTIHPRDRILVDKLSYDLSGKPKVGQIVVFDRPAADRSSSAGVLVKRVIGLPGQSLRSGPDGEVFVNGKPLAQPWLTNVALGEGAGPSICSAGNPGEVPQATADCRNGVLRLPADEYFVMGDHRGNSDDSRYWGPVSVHLLIGRAVARIWPVSRLRLFPLS